jgi:uncharacterized protein (DUF58 family)
MYYPAQTKGKIQFSTYVSSALALLLSKQRDAVGLCLFSDTIEELTPVKSTSTHLEKLYVLLENLLSRESIMKKETHVARVLHEVAEKIHKRSLVIIFSDMFDGGDNVEELFKALQHLKHNKHEVIVVHVMDQKTELDFQFEDRPVEFIDMESGDRLKLNPGDIRDAYKTEASRFHKSLKLRCNQYKIDFVEVDINKDLNLILQTYLIKRAKMR